MHTEEQIYPKYVVHTPKYVMTVSQKFFRLMIGKTDFVSFFMRNVYEKSHQSVTIRFDFISSRVVPDSLVVPDCWKCVAFLVETPMSSGWQSAVDPGSHWPPYKCPARGPGDDPHLEKHEVDRASEAGSIYKKINFTNKFNKDMDLINLQSWIKKSYKNPKCDISCAN